MNNSQNPIFERVALYQESLRNNKNYHHSHQRNPVPSPFYTLSHQEEIHKDSVEENLYVSRRKNDKSFRPLDSDKQPPISQLYDFSTIFGQIHSKNSPTFFYKNRLYLIGEMSPNLYKNQKYEIKVDDNLIKELFKVKEWDEQPQKVNNLIEIPVYSFEHKKWYVQKLRIRCMSAFADSYTFLQPSRILESTIRQKARQAEVAKLCGQPFKKVQKQKPPCYFPNELTNMACCKDLQINNIMYLFGGVYPEKFGYSNKFWKIDFDSLYIQMLDHRGEIPDPREGAALFWYSQVWIILHGGFNMLNCQVFSDFYIFHIDSRTWSLLEVDHESYFTPRINFSAAFNSSTKSCIIFGGTIFDHQNNQCLLNDMYEFKIFEEQMEKKSVSNRKFKGRVQTKILLPKECRKWPQKVKRHQSFWIDKNILILVGGELQKDEKDLQTTFESSIQLEESQKETCSKVCDKIWMFDTRTHEWTEVFAQKQEKLWKGCLEACTDYRLKLAGEIGQTDMIIFGGFPDQDRHQVKKLSFHIKDYDNFVRNLLQVENCELCQKKEGRAKKISEDLHPAVLYPAEMITEIINNSMPFAFTAFGILSSLAVESDSSKIHFHYSKISDPCLTGIMIESDGYLPYSAEEIASRIHHFSIHDSMEIQGVTDKKYKMHQTRINGITNFCNKLKMAGLRLGQKFIWIACNTYNEILVYELKLKAQRVGNEQISVYKSCFYALDENTGEILPGFSPEVKREIEEDNDSFLKEFARGKKNMKSTMKIMNLRKLKIEDSNAYDFELTPDFKRNNILVNCETIIDRKSVFAKSLIFQESIDVNLKAYLSMYFLQRQIKICLKVQLIGHYELPPALKLRSIEKQVIDSNPLNLPKNSSRFVNQVQSVMSEQINKKKQLLALLPDGPISNAQKFEEINFQFMLPKIDEKIQTGELIEIELDCFGQFDCKIIEVYYWMGKRKTSENQEKNANPNNHSPQITDDLLYSNGLLIYHKGQLIKRYKYSLGTLLLNQNFHHFGNLTKDQIKNTDQFYSSLNQYNTRLFGMIEVHDKYATNIFNNDFLNEQFLEKLYERIQHVSMLYEKMHGNWNGLNLGKISVSKKKPEENEGRSGRKKVKLSEENQKY